MHDGTYGSLQNITITVSDYCIEFKKANGAQAQLVWNTALIPTDPVIPIIPITPGERPGVGVTAPTIDIDPE
ncbi:hypothetical protein FACS189472_11410 [Alphaproteobacteria bacterium]|nr:hypothetical protein FACS189472_11410 [Alphaproteobacteria bacterium]